MTLVSSEFRTVPSEIAPEQHEDNSHPVAPDFTPSDILSDTCSVCFDYSPNGVLKGFRVEAQTHKFGRVSEAYNFSWPSGEVRTATLYYIEDAFHALTSPETAAKGLEILDEAKESGLIYRHSESCIEVDQFPDCREQIETLETREALEYIFEKYDISTESWGGENKTIDELVDELENRETRLMQDEEGVYLYTMVSRVDVFYVDEHGEELHLEEFCQRLYHGSPDEYTERRRDSVVSLGEKLLPDESSIDGGKRALFEELQIDTPVDLDNLVLTAQTEEVSADYPSPNLRHKKLLYTMEGWLSSEQYQNSYVEKDDKKEALYGWRSVA